MESVFHNNIDTLCFSGGGMKACAFYGALQYLEETKLIDMSKVKTFAGSSSGAITAFTFALGYSITDMIEFTLNFNFGIIEPIVNCDNIFDNYGLADNNKIPIIMENFIKTKYNKTDLTFLELYELTNNKLIITGSNITDLAGEYFNYLTTPGMSIILAIQISSCLPVIFNPIIYNNKYYVDGGVTDIMPLSQCNPYTTLALTITTQPGEVKSMERVILACADLILGVSLINPYNNKFNIIKLYDGNISCVDFNLTKECKQKLIDSGKIIAEEYIKNYEPKYSHKEIQTEANDDLIQVTINVNQI
jgi:hypothetical protein